MKKIFCLIIFALILQICNGQSKRYHYWTQIKSTECRAYGISPSLNLSGKIISIGFVYTWNKTYCDERTYKNAMRVPKVPKGMHLVDNKKYYNDGKQVYEVIGKACSSRSWKPQEFWVMVQGK
jgi:hypothetical protein